jgi:hypothetical protein
MIKGERNKILKCKSIKINVLWIELCPLIKIMSRVRLAEHTCNPSSQEAKAGRTRELESRLG